MIKMVLQGKHRLRNVISSSVRYCRVETK